jgi:hypothetical protein
MPCREMTGEEGIIIEIQHSSDEFLNFVRHDIEPERKPEREMDFE